MTGERHTIRAAVYILFIRDNNILLARRFRTTWGDGKYGLPAGHVDGNETVTQAAIREAREETGVHIEPEALQFIHVMHRMSDVEYIDFFFQATTWEGEPSITEPDKCDDIRWFPLDQLPDNTLQHVRFLIGEYIKGHYFSEYNWNKRSTS